MRDSDSIGNRYFYFSFATAFFVLSVLFLFMITSVNTPSTLPMDTGGRADGGADTYLPDEEDSLSVLFIGSAAGDGTAGSFILARFDPARGSVPVIAFPPQTLVQNGDRLETLAQVYQYGGSDYTRSALAATLGIPVDRYVYMDMNVFVACANAVGNVEFDLPLDLSLPEGGMQVTIRAGHQLLDGTRVGQIVSYPGFEGGELTRCAVAGQLAAAIVNQRMDIVESALADKVFEKIVNLADTDISYTDYDNRKEAARFLLELRDDPAVDIQVSGSFSGDGTQFTLSDTFVALLRQTLT